MIYEHPLAYLLGLEGIALLRSFTGEYDREFVDARLAEVRKFLDDETLATAARQVARVDISEGYQIWAKTYDGPNTAFDFDEPIVQEIVDDLPAGVALDAACGTGRMAAYLAQRGHQILGVDGSPDMLARASERVPQGKFLLGDLHDLPVPDNSVDLVTCSLALTHVPDLQPPIAEFARVLRPGGHLVISDMHPEGVARGFIPPVRRADGQPGRIATYRHSIGAYLRAALSVGLQVRGCEEPLRPPREMNHQLEVQERLEVRDVLEPWEVWPWSLSDLVPEAALAAGRGVPAMVIWHFQLEPESPAA